MDKDRNQQQQALERWELLLSVQELLEVACMDLVGHMGDMEVVVVDNFDKDLEEEHMY